MKFKIPLLTAFFSTIFFIPFFTMAQETVPFIGLVGIPGLTDPTATGGLNQYINALYRLSISIAALLAVVKIVAAGAKYMLSDIITHKEDAKKDIQGALIGLLIVIGAIIILNTVNTDLTKVDFSLQETIIEDEKVLTPADILEKYCGADGSDCITAICNESQNPLPGISEYLPAGSGVTCKEQCDSAKGFFYKLNNANSESLCSVSNTDFATLASNEKCPPDETCSITPCTEYGTWRGSGAFTCPTGCTHINGTYLGSGQCLVADGQSKTINCGDTPNGDEYRCDAARLQCYNENGYPDAIENDAVVCKIPKNTEDININTNEEIRDREIARLITDRTFTTLAGATDAQILRLLGLPSGLGVLGEIRIESEALLAASGGVTPTEEFLDAMAEELSNKCSGEEGIFVNKSVNNGTYDFYCID